MKINGSLFVVLSICVLALCVKFTQSTVAQDLTSVAKNIASVKSVCADVEKAESALKAERYDEAAEAAKLALSNSKRSDDRIRAYTLLISSVRSSAGYDAAIKRAGGVYAYILKTRPGCPQELVCLKTILADLKQRRLSYVQAIAQQQKVIKARPKSDEAAQAALKIATYKQKLGTPKDALAAYEEVVRSYPLTRSGWKAAQETALLRQNKTESASSTTQTEAESAKTPSVVDGLKLLREGNSSDAERIARQLIALKQFTNRGETVELLIRAVAANAGSKEAAKLAWQMACGSSEFTPCYSDVLRLEACVSDLNDQPLPAKVNIAEIISDTKKPDVLAEIPAQTIEEVQSGNDIGSPVAEEVAPSERGSGFQGSDSEQQMASGRTPINGLVGSVRANKASKATSVKTDSSPVTSKVEQPVITQPNPDQSVTPSPALPDMSSPPRRIDRSFDQWVCSKEYRAAADDPYRLAELIQINLATVDVLIQDSSQKWQRTGLAVALGAARCASDLLQDDAMAVGICNNYLLPNLDLASSKKWQYPSKDTILEETASIFDKAGAEEMLTELYTTWLADEPDQNRADWIRFNLATIAYNNGDEAGSKAYLDDISADSALNGAKQLNPKRPGVM